MTFNINPIQTAIISVGSTSFNELIQSILTPQTLNSLINLKITSLFIQYGTQSPILPTHLISTNQSNQYIYQSTLWISCHDFIQNIDHLLYTSKLVITHAGSGSILASLGLNFNLNQRNLIFIPNHNLMNSHQSDLIEEISKNQLGQTCEVNEIDKLIDSLNSDGSNLFQLNSIHQNIQGGPKRFCNLLNQEMNLK